MIAWLRELWTLIVRRSRTAWGIVIAGLTLVIPTLLDNLGVVHDLMAAIGAPPWVKPTLTIVGAMASAYALHARVSDAQSGKNPQ